MSNQVVYTGHFVDDPAALLAQHPPQLQGEDVRIYAHHVTREFRPPTGIQGVEVGRKRVLHGVGYVATPELHALLVEDPEGGVLSTGDNPHITIATANGTPPVASNEAIAKARAKGRVVPIEPPLAIPTTEGYFNGRKVVTG